MASSTQWTWVWVDSTVGDGQGGLVCRSSWGCKELDMSERLNWTDEGERTEWKSCLKMSTFKKLRCHLLMANRWGNNGKSGRFYFLGFQNHHGRWLQSWNKKKLAPWKESHDKPRQHIQKHRHHFAHKGLYSQSYDFSSSLAQMWELNHKESWVLKNWCFGTSVLEKTLESPLDSKDIKPVNHKKKWILNLHWKDWCWNWSSNTLATWCKELTHWKRPWCWERLRTGGEGGTKDEMVGWHNWLNENEFEQAPGDSEGQGSLACCSPWGPEEVDTQSDRTTTTTTNKKKKTKLSFRNRLWRLVENLLLLTLTPTLLRVSPWWQNIWSICPWY